MQDPRVIISSLTYNYLNIFDVRVEDNLVDILKLDGYVTEGMSNGDSDLAYDELLKTYCKNRCFVDDREYLYNSLCSSNLKREFAEDRLQLEITYRVLLDGIFHYYTGTYIRVSPFGEPLRLVAGFRIIDALVAKQDLIRDEAIMKGYEALSSLYLCMYRFDLLSGKYQCIKSEHFIREHAIPDLNDFKQQLPYAMRYLAVASYQDAVMRFVDCSTLAERMEGRNTIAMEFYATYSGWCRMRFIREDVDEHGNLKTVIFAVEVIDEAKQREISLKHLSETDQLSGLKNRATGVNEIIRLMQEKTKGLFCMIDCDKFKSINDTYGHGVGDQVIIAVAKCLQKACRSSDVLMRLGGDEYALFAPNICTLGEAENLWRRIFAELDKIVIPKMSDRKITVSFGCAFYKGESNIDFDELYRRADFAMYQSKKVEGNFATVSEQSMAVKCSAALDEELSIPV